jgi:hypothetical protein
LELTYGDGTVETFQVMFADFNMNLSKRGYFDFHEVTVSLEQV